MDTQTWLNDSHPLPTQPIDQPKSMLGNISYDTIHFVLGISHDGVDATWTFTTTNIDVSTLPLRMKLEFQVPNKQLHKDLIINH